MVQAAQAREEGTAQQQAAVEGAETVREEPAEGAMAMEGWEAATAVAVVADAATLAAAMVEAEGRAQQVAVAILVQCTARAQRLPGSQLPHLQRASR